MIEYLGIALIENVWPEFLRILLKYLHDPFSQVRQTASYAIGVMAKQKGAHFSEEL